MRRTRICLILVYIVCLAGAGAAIRPVAVVGPSGQAEAAPLGTPDFGLDDAGRIVVAGATVADGETTLPTISGTVTNSATGVPLGGVEVVVYRANGTAVRSTTTDTEGRYSLWTGGTGTFYARTTTATAKGFLDQLFDRMLCPPGNCAVTAGTPITATAGADTPGIDFPLQEGGRVSGRVTRASDGNPLEGVVVWLYDEAGRRAAEATTNGTGVYTAKGLQTGTYRARSWNALGYADLVHRGVACPVDACQPMMGQPVAVTRGATTVDIDFALSVSSGAGAAQVAANSSQSCAVTRGGGVRCWGENRSGSLGDGTTISRNGPVAVTGLGSGVRSVTVGVTHACAVTAGGAVQCWGLNSAGQLGDGTWTSSSVPVAVSGLTSGVQSVAAGSAHTCGVVPGGAVDCWGYNSFGQLGDGTTTSRNGPVAVTGLAGGVQSVAAGGFHSCAVLTGGALRCWGRNESGQLGDGTTTDRTSPVGVIGLESGVRSVAAGSGHTCAVTSGGAVYCWGLNSAGQLGNGTWTSSSVPVAVSGLASGVQSVAAGGAHTCGVATGGAVRCWGLNISGQLGDGTGVSRPVEAAVSLLASAVAVTAGFRHTCVVTESGGVLCFGDNRSGQLGDGTVTNRPTPVGVAGLGGGLAAPTISAVQPASGPSTGHTAVTVVGTGFEPGAVVTVGGVAATSVVVVDATTLTATIPPHAAGLVDVAVTTPNGVVTLAGGFRYAAVRADFAGSGTSGLVWQHGTNGQLWLWGMSGGTAASQVHVADVAPEWEVRGVGDQTGDGRADLLWRHRTTGVLFLWTMEGTTPAAYAYVGSVDPVYDIVGTGDYDGDGKSDLLWRHQGTGELWVWLMDGATIRSVTGLGVVPVGYAVVGSGDVNGDGRADIVWRHASNGEVWVWLMNGATPTQQSYLGAVGDPGWSVVGVDDVSGDGRADLVWRHATNGEVWVWLMNGAAITQAAWVGTVGDPNYRIVGTGDYDGDGRADLLWHHATTGDVWVWAMHGGSAPTPIRVGRVADVGYQIRAPR